MSEDSHTGARPLSPLGLAVRFYLGLGAPAKRGSFARCLLRAAPAYPLELVQALVSRYRGASDAPEGAVQVINFRCARIRPAGCDGAFFVKEFPRHHALHDVERWLRCSRVDRAWRAGHLLPRLGVLTPRPVGTAQARLETRAVAEYLITEWLEGAAPFPQLLKGAGAERRAVLLQEFAREMARWHSCGIYLRDLVKNVLVTEAEEGRGYWLTDLDGLHPLRRVTRRRVLQQMRQLGHWAKPLRREEAKMTAETYLGEAHGDGAEEIVQALLLPSAAAD